MALANGAYRSMGTGADGAPDLSSQRLLFVITTLGWGGAESQVVDLAVRLNDRGWDVAVAVLLASAERRATLDAAGIPIHTLGMVRGIPDPRAVWRLAQLVRRTRPSIVHAHMVHANILARVTRAIAPMPVLITSAHNTNEGSRWREIAYRVTDSLTDLTTNVSNVAVQRYVAVRAAPKGRIRFMPNGIDVHRFGRDTTARDRLRAELNLKNRFVWLAVGRFDEEKDYPNLLHAFAAIKEHAAQPFLVIAGDGPLRQQMQARTAGLGMRECVQFLGLRTDVPQLMSAADAYVLSSVVEGLPVVLLEAAASDLPTVATDVGGNAQIVRDGESGVLVRPRDSRRLAEAMMQMMNMPEHRRAAWGKAGGEYVRATFALDRVIEEWEHLYHDLYRCRVSR